MPMKPSSSSPSRPLAAAVLVGVVLVGVLGAIVGCGGGGGGGGVDDPTEAMSGGATTVFNTSLDAFGFPAANLTGTRSDPFFIGNQFFRTNWVTAPSSTTGRDGLGPIFNAVGCSACHLRDGRGRPPELPSEKPVSLLFKIVRPGLFTGGVSSGDDVYGDQLQTASVDGVDAEAEVAISYVEEPGTFPDGTPYSLRRPTYTIANPAYGAIAADAVLAPRVAPAVFGLGLLATVPESDLLSRVDPTDLDQDGVSGRANFVFDIRSNAFRLGRFGWKANQPTLEQQAAGAFNGDVGLTTELFPTDALTPTELATVIEPDGGTPEVEATVLDPLTFYMHTLAVPGRRNVSDPVVRRGRVLFRSIGCASCHTTTLVTGDDPAFPELSSQVIHPFTDLLLHDMGPDLADGRTEFGAGPSEWRTPPLWGIGLQETVSGHTFFLHDGRARDLVEAILWHGGEGQGARDRYRLLSLSDRNALRRYLEDL